MTDDELLDAMIRDGIEYSSVAVCRTMARFCLRMSQTANCPDDMRAALIATANRWHDGAVAKLDAERVDNQRNSSGFVDNGTAQPNPTMTAKETP